MNKTLYNLDFLVSRTSATDCDSMEKSISEIQKQMEGKEDELVQGSGRVGAHSKGSLVTDHFSFSTSQDQISTNQTNLRNNNTDVSAIAATGVN